MASFVIFSPVLWGWWNQGRWAKQDFTREWQRW